MTQQTGAPAAVQPSDDPPRFSYAALLDALAEDERPGVYRGPTMDAAAQARAAEWLGVRVYHPTSHEFGMVVGRDPAGRFWVTCAVHPRDKPAPRLFVGDALLIATVALEQQEGVWHKQAEEPPPLPAEATCTKCHKTKPSSEFTARRDRPGTLMSWCKRCKARQTLKRRKAPAAQLQEAG